MLKVGVNAPPVSLLDDHGQNVTLFQYRGRPVLLWFYPKADTPG